MSSKQADTKPISTRSAVIMALALLVAIGAGLLTYLSERSLPASVLTAGGAWAAAVVFFNTIIDKD
jgi:heme A synthase